MLWIDDPSSATVACSATVSAHVAEIVFFLFKVGESMLEPSVRLFIYQEVCRQEYPNDTTCYVLSRYPWKEKHVQSLSGDYMMYYKIPLNMPAIFLGLFCGAWSDKIGRKLPVMLPCLGTILAALFYMMALLDNFPSLPLILLGAALRGAFGKSAVITMALHSYVADVSTKEIRTTKFGRLLSMNFFGYFAGSLISGTMLDISGFDVIFCTVVFLDAACILVTLVFMKEHNIKGTTSDPAVEKKGSPKIPFHISHVKESLSVVTRPRENHARAHLIVFFTTVIVHQACKSGEIDITLLFVERSPLSWRKALYGYLLATDYAFLGISVFFFLPILSQFLKLSDTTLVLIGLFFKAIRMFCMSMSTTTWMVFCSVILGCPSAMIISGSKSLISKLVSENEIGKAFSLLSCGETVSNLIGSVTFINLYVATITVYPGLAFIIEGCIFVVFGFVVIITGRDMKAMNSYGILDEEEEDSDKKNYGTNGHAVFGDHELERKGSNVGTLPGVPGTIINSYQTRRNSTETTRRNTPLQPNGQVQDYGTTNCSNNLTHQNGIKIDKEFMQPTEMEPSHIRQQMDNTH